MTVADLIKQLQQMDQNAEVWGNSSVSGECGPIASNPFYTDTIEWFYSNSHKCGYWISKRYADGPGGQNKDVIMIDIV